MAKREEAGFPTRLADLRAKIERLQIEISGVEEAPVDLAQAYARADAWVEKQTERCPIDAMEFLYTRQRFGLLYHQHEDVAALALWLDPQAAKKRLRDAIDQCYAARGSEGLSDEQRRIRLNKAKDELYELELAEERLIREAEAQGIELPRRSGADPRALMFA